MTINYNNLSTSQLGGIVTFTDVPNILKVSEYITGTKAIFQFTFQSGLQSTVTADSQYYVTFLSETVSNVMNPSNAKNKRFYISDANGTAMSFCRALRNCSSLAADFNIIQNTNTVTLVSKTIGQKWSNIQNFFDRNIPSQYLTATGTDGSANSNLFGGKISIDVYDGTIENGNYVTTLEKNWYGDGTAFDVSPVLATFSEYGKTEPYSFNISAVLSNGGWQQLGTVSGNTTIGYEVNQSDRYKFIGNAEILLNTNRNIIHYVYKNVIDYSVLSSSNSWNANVTCYDSAMNVVYGMSVTQTSQSALSDQSIEIPMTAFTDSYYVDIRVGGVTHRWEVIKPLRATEYSQRIKWRNEYGGIEFIDFTGQRSEQDTVNIETYEKNIFDYYDSYYERKRIYDNNYEKSVTMSTHLMKEKGKYVFNSLMNSKRVWSDDIVSNKTYYIIPKSIEVTEDNQYNGIFVGKLTFTFSDI